MYIHELHDVVSNFEDWVVSIVFTFWIYDWLEDRVKKFLAWRKKRKAQKWLVEKDTPPATGTLAFSDKATEAKCAMCDGTKVTPYTRMPCPICAGANLQP